MAYTREDFIEELQDLAALRKGRLTAQRQRRIYGRQVDKYPLTDDRDLDNLLAKLYSFRVAAHNFLFTSAEARNGGKIDGDEHRRRLAIIEYYAEDLAKDVAVYASGPLKAKVEGGPRPTPKGEIAK